MFINGKKSTLEAGISILEMLRELELDAQKVVVEVNAVIIEKTAFENHRLNTGDKIEIIAFVGGG
jgi:thiamine biosynthesis protein ThiS